MKTGHIVAYLAPAWGQIKPLLVLIGRIAERRSNADAITFTLLLGNGPMLQKVLREVECMPASVREHIHVVDVGQAQGFLDPHPNFTLRIQDLWKSASVFCEFTLQNVSLPKPSVVIVVPPYGFAIPMIRDVMKGKCPIIMWFPAPISSFMGVLGPENMGGHGDLAAKIEATARELGKTPVEVADLVYKRYEGKVRNIPGLPPMYDYDFFPQEDNLPFPMGIVVQHLHKHVQTCDGVLAASTSAFEKEAISSGRKWLESVGLDTYVVGPLEDAPARDVASNSNYYSEEDAKIFEFLNSMQQKHGNKTVIYMAFGTVFYPANPGKLHAFLDEIIASGTPILWGHAAPSAVVPADLAEKFAATANAYHANWIPQSAVLSHPAIGWYITHGGFNGIQEALGLRVPMIMWPFAGDQPSNAALLNTVHRAAFELTTIRTGKGAQQPYSLADQAPVDFSEGGVRREARELLAKLKGPGGLEVRKNTEALGEAMEKPWMEGGEAVLELERFLNKYIISV